MKFLLVRLILWLVPLAAFSVPVTILARSFQVELLRCINGDLAWECSAERRCVDVVGLPDRVLVRLQESEEEEIDPWFRDDIRIAWITVKWSQSGVPDWAWLKESPHVSATFQVLQLRPEQVWPYIVAKRREKLGPEYARFFDESGAVAVSAKKPCVSEHRRTRRKGVVASAA